MHSPSFLCLQSSLIAALARLVEPCEGSDIRIDGVDTRTLPLRTLRSVGVTIISQDTLFFSGSLRRNLDPFGLFTEEELLDALKQVHLFDFALAAVRGSSGASSGNAEAAGSATPALGTPTGASKALPLGTSSSSSKALLLRDAPSSSQFLRAPPPPPSPLDMLISERGSNLSVGQQQLLALARAVLRRPRIALLDEATASVDAETEALVCSTLVTSFPGATLVIVAHRLASVVDSDRVIVLEAGRVVESGSPWELLQGSGQQCATSAGSSGADDITVGGGRSSSSSSGGGERHFASMVEALPPAQREGIVRRAKEVHDARLRRVL